MRMRTWTLLTLLLGLLAATSPAQSAPEGKTFRLYNGITAFINNPKGEDFTFTMDVRDINTFANGPREVLIKVYDPSGKPVVREIIPDDGCVTEAFQPRIGGWDHELSYYALCRDRGLRPMINWSSYSDPKRIATYVKRTFTYEIKGGLKGDYRAMIVGARDHFVTLTIDPNLSYGVSGHSTWRHAHGDQIKKKYFYVPKDTKGMHFAIVEPDVPATRVATLRDQRGNMLQEISAPGGLESVYVKFDGKYDDQILTLSVSDGPNAYLIRATVPRKTPNVGYGGFDPAAVLCDDAKTARAIKNGAIYAHGGVYYHPWQVNLRTWLNNNDQPADIVKEIDSIAAKLMQMGISDALDLGGWGNMAYAFGYYGCPVWRQAWLLSKNPDVPKEPWGYIKEALIMGGDRLSFSVGIERCNGNAFAQIPVALWYCQATTGDKMNRERYNVFFERWRTEGWGEGTGISPSGDSQEHFGHDSGYGSYILSNWQESGGTWVKNQGGGILKDTDDPRFQEVFDGIRNVFAYVSSRKGRPCHMWNSRIWRGPVSPARRVMTGEFEFKGGVPGPDLTMTVNGGNEWFVARRKNYYAVTFHGRIVPEWLCNTFAGQMGFSGGGISRIMVTGKDAVLNSTTTANYGSGDHVSQWRKTQIHAIVGEMNNGQPFHTGISEHPDAKLVGNVVTSSGDVRGVPLRVSRKYTYNDSSIDCEVQLAPADYRKLVTLWSRKKKLHFDHVREAYEVFPHSAQKVTIEGRGEVTDERQEAKELIFAGRTDYGVRIEFERPVHVRKGGHKRTIFVELVAAGGEEPTAPENVALKYRITPYLGKP